MRCNWNIQLISAIAYYATALTSGAVAFEGRFNADLTRGTETNVLLYTVGPGFLRIENVTTNWPHPVNIVDLKSGAVTLLFPHNRSFVRLKSVASHSSAPSSFPAMPPAISPQAGGNPAIPRMPGVGPQTGNQSLTATPMIPMPMMLMSRQQSELQATTNTTTILGLPCTRYELKQRGETLEIWATDKLIPFHPWLQNEPSRFGPRRIEEQWPEMLMAKGLFPLRAILKYEHGPERLRFEVKSITPEKVIDERLFQPPAGYHELEPLPF